MLKTARIFCRMDHKFRKWIVSGSRLSFNRVLAGMIPTITLQNSIFSLKTYLARMF
jgi:hypothetical protein